MTTEQTIRATTHGRYLADVDAGSTPDVLIVGFHGYGETATVQMARLHALREASPAGLVAIQALHRFYGNDGTAIAASWMTREDRELMIADNVAYVDGVLDAVAGTFGEPRVLIYTGFSQGASMAYRAAVLGRRRAAGVAALGGDVPPEIDAAQLARVPRVLIGRGARDRFYDAGKAQQDVQRLKDAGAQVSLVPLDAGHAWTEEFSQAARRWISELR